MLDPNQQQHAIIFKSGDDLRQDQLVVQMIMLMDRLLKKEKLDLSIVTYKVLATSRDEGIVEWIKSTSLASILSEYGDIQDFLRKKNSDVNSPFTFGIQPTVFQTYIKSCGRLLLI